MQQAGIEVIFNNMTMIDNRYGINLNIMGKGATEYKTQTMRLNNIVVYGECEIPDCIDENNEDHCFKEDKYGVIAGSSQHNVKGPHENGVSALPPMLIMKDPAWGGVNIWTNLTFVDFKKETLVGLKNSIVGTVASASDYIPPVTFFNSKFVNVA